MTNTEKNTGFLDKDEVIGETLGALYDFNRITNLPNAAAINKTASSVDKIISQTTGRARKTLIDDILGYMNRHGLTLLDQPADPGFDYEEEDLYEIGQDGLEYFLDQSGGKKSKSALKKLRSFSNYVRLRVDKIISHQDFEDARESMAEQNNPKTGKLFRNGLNVIMARFGFLPVQIEENQSLYHGLRRVADDEPDLGPNDDLEELLSAERYAKVVDQSLQHGIVSRPSLFNLPSLEGIDLTTDLKKTQGLVVFRLDPGQNKVWRHPIDNIFGDLQIFQHMLQPPIVEVMIKDGSFLSADFLNSQEARPDIMRLAAQRPTLFQEYLSRLTARLDYLHIPYQYVDVNGNTHQITRVAQPPKARSSGKIILSDADAAGTGNVVHVDFRASGK